MEVEGAPDLTADDDGFRLRTDTRGGALVWTAILIALPFAIYGPISEAVGDELQVLRSLGRGRAVCAYVSSVRLCVCAPWR